jgi:hypothetical protein
VPNGLESAGSVDFGAPFVEVEDWVTARVGELVDLARVVEVAGTPSVVVVLLLSVLVVVLAVDSSSTDDEEVELSVVSADLLDVVAAAVVFLLWEEEVWATVVVFGVAFAEVDCEVLSGGSLSTNTWAVSSASSILGCGIALPIPLHADARGVMNEESNDRISFGQL